MARHQVTAQADFILPLPACTQPAGKMVDLRRTGLVAGLPVVADPLIPEGFLQRARR